MPDQASGSATSAPAPAADTQENTQPNSNPTPQPQAQTDTAPSPDPTPLADVDALRKELEAARKEAANYRVRLRGSETELSTYKRAGETETEKAARERDEAKAQVEALLGTVRESNLRSVVMAEGSKAGAVYPDALVALVKSAGEVEYDEAHAPKDVVKRIAELKKAYPALFRAVAGSADGGAGRDDVDNTTRLHGDDLLRAAYDNIDKQRRQR